MIDEKKIAFKDSMKIISAMYSKPPLDNDTLRVWWATLTAYDTDIVAKAFGKWVASSSYMPTPSDILGLCKAQSIEYTKLAPPVISKEQSKEHSNKVNQYVNSNSFQHHKSYKNWARKIIAEPKKYPAISLKFATIAINDKTPMEKN